MGKDLKGKELGVGITQRVDGRYMGRYTDSNGIRRCLYNEKLSVLKKQLEKARYENNQDVYSKISLNVWFDEYLKLYKVSKVKETTVYRIKQTYSVVRKSDLGSMQLSKIKGLHIQRLVNELDIKGYSRGTLELLKSLLNEMFRRAIGNGMILMNPCDSVVLPVKQQIEARYLTEEEQRLFLESAKGYAHEDVFLTNLTTGLRIGELLALKWTDIDFDKNTIQIKRTLHYGKLDENDVCHFFFTTPKTESSSRCIPLLPETKRVLMGVRNKQIQNQVLYKKAWSKVEFEFRGLVFTTQKGIPLRYGDVNRSIKKIISKSNMLEKELAKLEGRDPVVIKPFSPHCFRHTFITRARQKGLAYDTLRLYVGHTNKEMTQHYDHNEEQMDIEALNNISFLEELV